MKLIKHIDVRSFAKQTMLTGAVLGLCLSFVFLVFWVGAELLARNIGVSFNIFSIMDNETFSVVFLSILGLVLTEIFMFSLLGLVLGAIGAMVWNLTIDYTGGVKAEINEYTEPVVRIVDD